MEPQKILSREARLTERIKLLAEEKQFSRRRDGECGTAGAASVRVEKEYVFDPPEGTTTLAELIQL